MHNPCSIFCRKTKTNFHSHPLQHANEPDSTDTNIYCPLRCWSTYSRELMLLPQANSYLVPHSKTSQLVSSRVNAAPTGQQMISDIKVSSKKLQKHTHLHVAYYLHLHIVHKSLLIIKLCLISDRLTCVDASGVKKINKKKHTNQPASSLREVHSKAGD